MANTFALLDTNALTKEFNQTVNQISTSFKTQINEQLNVSINTVTQNIAMVGQALDQATESEKMKGLSEQLNGLKDSVEKSFQQVTEFVGSIGALSDSLGNAFQGGIQKAQGFLNTYVDSFGNLDTALLIATLQQAAFSKAASLIEDPIATAQNTIAGLATICTGSIEALSSITSAVNGVKEAYGNLSGISETLIGGMNGISGATETSLVPAFGSMMTTILPVVGVIALIALAIAGLTLGFQYLYENSATFRDGINEIFTSIQTHITGIITGIVEIIHTIYTEGIQPIIESTLAAFDELWNNGLSAFIENISIFVFQIIDMVLGIWDNAINPLINLLLETFLPMFTIVWDAILAIAVPIIEKIMEYVNAFMNVLNIVIAVLNEHVWPIFKTVFDGLSSAVHSFWEFIQPIFSWFTELLGNVVTFILDSFMAPFDAVFQTIVSIIQNIADPIGKVFDGIKGVFQGVIDFVTGIFSGDWQKAWDGVIGIFKGLWDSLSGIVEGVWNTITSLFSRGGEIFSGVQDGIASAFKSIVNTMISGINTVIAFPFNIINGLLNDVRGISVMGFQPFTFIPYNALPIPQIPQLARGGIVAQPTLAMVGERGKEAIMPLEHNTGWIDELAQRTAAYGSSNSLQTQLLQRILTRLEDMQLEVNLDGEVIYRNQEKLRNRKGLRFSNI